MTAARGGSPAVEFHDHYLTPLPGGSYRLVLGHTVEVGPAGAPDETRRYYRDQRFEVVSPRYHVERDELQAYHPPPGATGEFGTTLPHVVLRTRSLPWERTVWADDREPWLGLLVVAAGEIPAGGGVRAGTVSHLTPDRDGGRTRREDGVDIAVPWLSGPAHRDTPLRYLDLDAGLVRGLLPRRADLAPLAHVRVVGTQDKVPLQMPEDGQFSVVVANRFPPPGACEAHLVSLEGWGRLIAGDDPGSAAAARIRMVSLATWSFVNDPGGRGTFAGLAARLRDSARAFGVAPPPASGGPAGSADTQVREALERGYVPLDYRPAASTPTMAWYRGPFSPIPRAVSAREPFGRADAALIHDERTGVLDVSYAAAWQLGRMVALSAPAFVTGLRHVVTGRQDADEFADQLVDVLDMHRSELREGATGAAGELMALRDWLARLVLLDPVPLHYLAPHPALLPPESLRFFHVDRSWVDAMMDGALCADPRTARDDRRVTRDQVQADVGAAVATDRARRRGADPDLDPSPGDAGDPPMSGFLLRSDLVSGWPGVEITAPGADIVRMDHVADGVLLCLVNGIVDDVVIREPAEGLTFGVQNGGVDGDEFLDLEEVPMRSDAPAGVVDVSGLRARLGGRAGPVGPAEFALRMLRRPQVMTISWRDRGRTG